MARKRYISTDISGDTKVAELSDCSLLGTLLYTWAIPHMDDWGRITGNYREFKSLVCPNLDLKLEDVKEAIDQIVKVKLWFRYEVDGKQCISIMNQKSWFKHQSYIAKDKRLDDSSSPFPAPQNAEERRETPKNTEKERETPQNTSSFSFSLSSSASINTPITTTRPHKDNPFSLFETHKFGKLDDLSRDFIGDTIDTYTEDWVTRAIKESVKANVVVWKYVEKILLRWKISNHPEPWTLEKEEPPPKTNVRNFNRSSTYSGKPSLPINHNPAISTPLSDERKQAMRQKAMMLDGKPG